MMLSGWEYAKNKFGFGFRILRRHNGRHYFGWEFSFEIGPFTYVLITRRRKMF
jgi:hypothetical protein